MVECSTIGSMSLLTVVVVITRIAVNKHFPHDDSPRPNAYAPGPTVRTVGLMMLVGVIAAVVLTVVVFATAPTE